MYHDTSSHTFDVRLATTAADVHAAQALRYDVFVDEGGASGGLIDHDARREVDPFDAHADHLLLFDNSLPADSRVVGTYRLMTRQHAMAAGGFYSATEFDVTAMLNSDLSILELGRSCLRKPYRGGTALMHLWRGVGRYVAEEKTDLLFGVASFRGTDPSTHAHALSYLHHEYLADVALRPVVQGESAINMNILPKDAVERRTALTQLPALIKAYLRLGGVVGDGAFVDRAFNTIDVCLMLEAGRLSARQRAFYEAA
ncbi:MAG: GNAT family N-acyltransferase [Pseudomonadota bacterium]